MWESNPIQIPLLWRPVAQGLEAPGARTFGFPPPTIVRHKPATTDIQLLAKVHIMHSLPLIEMGRMPFANFTQLILICQ